MVFKIYPDQVRKESLIPYLENHYEELSKEQIYDLTLSYIKESYMRNGNTHVNITNEILKKYMD